MSSVVTTVSSTDEANDDGHCNCNHEQPLETSFDWTRMKDVDDNTKHLLFGYFRGVQRQLFPDRPIPELITKTCLLFYFINDDEKERKPSITDLDDMYIIPDNYLDDLLEEAVAIHQRRHSRLEHIRRRLVRHLPESVAHSLAETLATSVTMDDDEDQEQLRTIDAEHDEQWDVSFVYNNAPMQDDHDDENDEEDDESNEAMPDFMALNEQLEPPVL